MNENLPINFKYKIETNLLVVAAFSPNQRIKVILPKMGSYSGQKYYIPQLMFGGTIHKSRTYSEM